MKTKYFLPIDSACLPIYYGRAAVIPSKYLTNKIEDIQDRFRDYLLITTKKGTAQTDCALELELTISDENELFPISDAKDIFLLSKPLPITRVRFVYFNDNAKREQMLAIINLSTAFIDNTIAQVDSDMEMTDLSKIDYALSKNTFDWTSNLDKYNRFLGGLALMRFSGEPGMRYSENYFSTLSFFNSRIEEDFVKAGKTINNTYHDAFFGKDRFSTLYKYLFKELSESDIYMSASAEGQEVLKNNLSGTIELDNLEKITYIVAVLFLYRVGEEAGQRKIDSLIVNNFTTGLKFKHAELISLCYGLNRGYNIFSNRYKIQQKEKVVKFKLDNQLDYYTIESIYQCVFNGVEKSSNFEFLDEWCPKQNVVVGQGAYRVLDQVIEERQIQNDNKKIENTGGNKSASDLIEKGNEDNKMTLDDAFKEIKRLQAQIKDNDNRIITLHTAIKKQKNIKAVKELIKEFESKSLNNGTLFS